MIQVKIIADSVNVNGNRITTFVLTYPRFIHSEFMTHRVISRNAASSRDIPILTMLGNVLKTPAEPVTWGMNGKGMQAKQELGYVRRLFARALWIAASYFACLFAWLLSKLGVHEQLANRLIEPWAHMTTIATATEWANFFNLRCHKDAQPEFQELAFKMLEAYTASTPKRLVFGEWHLPFADKYIGEGLTNDQLLKITVARCARVSYLNFEGDIDHQKDYDLHDRLLEQGHMSPFEHAAQAAPSSAVPLSNFKGWFQYRKTIATENRSTLDANAILAARIAQWNKNVESSG